MNSRARIIALSITLVLLGAGIASAEQSKLDARVRGALAQWRNGASIESLRQHGLAVSSEGWLDVFIAGSASREALEAQGAIVRTAVPGLCTAFLPLRAIPSVAALSNVTSIRGAVPVHKELNASVPATGVSTLRGVGPTFTGLNGAGVLIGTVDTGVSYKHEDFKDAGLLTRIVRIWDQTTTVRPGPLGYGYGSEWSRASIDSGTCTERDLDGHGTHVLGIAGGDGSQTGQGTPAYTYAGMAPMADLVVVKSDLLSTTKIVDGVKYCFDIAGLRGENAVVNLSLGTQYGPHDGTSDFESMLSALCGPGRIICKSAGNDRGVNAHAQVNAAGVGTDITVSVSGSSGSAYLEIDGWYNGSENLNLKVRTPNGTILGPLPVGSQLGSYPDGQSTPDGSVYLENGVTPNLPGNREVYALVTIDAGGTQNMDGTWTFTLIPVTLGASNGRVDTWLTQISQNLTANFVSGMIDQVLISEPGNADSLITVAAWASKRSWVDCGSRNVTDTSLPTVGGLPDFSSPGPTRDGRQKPDITAPGAAIGSALTQDFVSVCPAGLSNVSLYIHDAATANGPSHIYDEGTSMASPHGAGAVAVLLQKFGAKSPSWIKQFIATNAQVDGFTGAVWNADWGHGKLYIDATSIATSTLLALFDLEPLADGIQLRWQLGDPAQFSSVGAERADHTNGPWVPLTAAVHDDAGATVLLDRTAESGHTYYYRLVATTLTGERLTFGPLSATAGALIADLALAPVAPNPTTGRARIEYTIPRETRVRLSVLDLQGREVAVLANGVQHAGRFQVTWSGSTGDRAVPPGLYFIRLGTPHENRVERIVVAR